MFPTRMRVQVRVQMVALFEQHGIATVEQAFKGFDANGDGNISHEEFATGLRQMDIGVTEAQIEQMVGLIDTDGDGAIDVQEFQAWITQGAGAGAGAEVDPAQLLATAAAELGLGLFDGGEFLPGLLLPDHGIQCLAHITARPVVYPWHRCHNIV